VTSDPYGVNRSDLELKSTEMSSNRWCKLQSKAAKNEGEILYMCKKCRYAPKEVCPNLKGIVDVSCEAPPAKEKASSIMCLSLCKNQKMQGLKGEETLALDFLLT